MKEEKNGVKEIYLAPETNNPEADTAVNIGASDEMTDADFPVMVEKPKANFRVGEILELRDDNRKVYRMSDGTEQAVFYPEPVHTFNKAAKIFEDVDNTLAEGEDGKYFVSGRMHFVAKLSREEETDELFLIESGIHRVTVSAKKNRKQKNKGVKPGIHKIVTEDLKTTDMLVFEGVQDNADYEYCVTGKGVKENIVVKEKSDVYRYSFILRQENVTAEFDETKKRISFNSNESGKEVFYIPAPFMTDANGVTSDSVFYEFKYRASGDAVLNVTADSDWLNTGERAFPVVIDPQIQLSGETAMTTLSYNNGCLYESSVHTVGVHRGGNDNSVKRMYMKFNIPALPRNPRIKKAELTFFQMSGVSQCGEYPKIGIYKVNGELSPDAVPPCNEDDLIDFAVMKIGHLENGAVISYTFDVTSLADEFNKGESEYSNLVLKMIDGTYTANNEISLYGSAYGGDYAPQFAITYESAYGVNTSYRTHTHELGRFGQGSIDLQCGSLMFDSEDFAWAGNRMPVTIRHLYNSALSAYQYTENSGIKLNTADFSAMKIGYGFKLNIMQSVKPAAFRHEGVMTEGYVYIGENGEEAYFKESSDQIWNGGNSHCYNLYEEVNDGGILYNPVKRTLQQDEKTYQFDTLGRLIQIKDAFGSHMDITYTAGRITSVTDGAGREFGFAYNTDGFLTSVTAPDNTSILYTYSEDKLSTVTYPNGKKAVITYVSDKPQAVTLLDADGNNVYKVAYTFSGDRIVGVTEYGAENGSLVIGNNSVYSYSAASGKTTVQTTEQADNGDESAVNVIKTVYTFDDDGDVVSEYVYTEDTGNTGVKGEEAVYIPIRETAEPGS